MTQVIAVTTQRSVFLVADRRLTYGPGPRKGELVDDDTCKLVSLGGVCAIGYTGLADLGAQPTHEWVATLLAAANCDRGSAAARIPTEKSTELFSRLPGPFSHSFVMVGWARFNGLPRPYIIEITNCRGADGSLLETPVHEFVALVSRRSSRMLHRTLESSDSRCEQPRATRCSGGCSEDWRSAECRTGRFSSYS